MPETATDTAVPVQSPLLEDDGSDYYFWHKWLVEPIRRDDLPAIRKYLDGGGGIHVEDVLYHDPFVVAARRPNPAALRMLLDHWAVKPTPELPGPNERGLSLFAAACAKGGLETARYLLDEQPALVDLHSRDPSLFTPILYAAESLALCARDEGEAGPFDARVARERVQRSEALVHLLLDRGACAADRAARSSMPGMTVSQLDVDVDVNVDDDGQGDTVLGFAIARAGPALLRRLIREGADVYATTRDRSHSPYGLIFKHTGTSAGLTLMHLGAYYGNYAGIEVVLERYAQDVRSRTDAMSARDQFGRLPVHYAAAGWPGAVSTIRSGADADAAALIRALTDNGDPRLCNAKDAHGETPLHYAVSRNTISHSSSTALARLLCTEFHASAAVRGRGGQTPLHRLYDAGVCSIPWGVDAGLVGVMLGLPGDRAADTNAVDDAGKTPLHYAAWRLGDLPGAQFLVSRGADVRAQEKAGRTPLHMAAGGFLDYIFHNVTVAQSIRAQDAMLALLCGFTDTDTGLVLDKNDSPLMEEPDADGKTPRQLAEETRAQWRHEEAERSKPRDWTRGRGTGRGRGSGRGGG